MVGLTIWCVPVPPVVAFVPISIITFHPAVMAVPPLVGYVSVSVRFPVPPKAAPHVAAAALPANV